MKKFLFLVCLVAMQAGHMFANTYDFKEQLKQQVNKILTRKSFETVLHNGTTQEIELFLQWYLLQQKDKKIQNILASKAFKLGDRRLHHKALLLFSQFKHYQGIVSVLSYEKFSVLYDPFYKNLEMYAESSEQAYYEVKEIINYIVQIKKIAKVPNDQLTEMLRNMIENDDACIIPAFFLEKITIDDIEKFDLIEEAFFRICYIDKLRFAQSPEVAALFIQSKLFRDIPAEGLSSVLDCAATQQNATWLISLLMKHPKYKHISADYIAATLLFACQANSIQSAQLLIRDANTFNKIKTQKLFVICKEIVSRGQLELLELLIASPKFYEFAPRQFAEILQLALQNGHIGIARLLRPYDALKPTSQHRYPYVAGQFIQAYEQFLQGNSNNLHNLIFPVSKDVFALFPHPHKQTPPMVIIGQTLFDVFKKECIKPLLVRLIQVTQMTPAKQHNDIKYLNDLLEYMQLEEAPAATKIQQAVRKHQMRGNLKYMNENIKRLQTLQELPQEA